MEPQDVSTALDELKRHRTALARHCSKAETLPDPAPQLDLESRAGDRVRTIKHVHQLCFGHCQHYVVAGRIKLTHLVDGYLTLAEQRNPVGVFALARSLLEFYVSGAHLSNQLSGIAGRLPSDLVARGREFFATIVKARYATKDPRLRDRLVKAGVPAEYVAWPQITPFVKQLAADPHRTWIAEHYDVLCDYVHHNGPSNSLAAAALPFGAIARNRKGLVLTEQPGTQVTYLFPSEAASRGALEITASRALESLEGSLKVLDTFPKGPFSAAELRRETGTATGVPFLTFAGSRKVGRNHLCPCGSGLKFKKCHG